MKPRAMQQLRRAGIYPALVKTLEAAGITEHKIEYTGKHPAIIFLVKGRFVKYKFPLTPSCNRAALNAASDIRKYIRGDL